MEYDETTTPALCEECLGPNKHVALRRVVDGAQCKICTRPYTLFKWNAQKYSSGGGDFKRTVICSTCARARNCCQCCMRDLLMGVNERLRDQLIKEANLGEFLQTRDNVDVIQNATTTVGRMYNANALERRFSQESVKEMTDEERRMIIERLEQYLQRLTHVPALAAKRKFKPLAKDQLAKLMGRLPLNGNLAVLPSDETIKTFFLFGLTERTYIYSVKECMEALWKERGGETIVEAVCVSPEGGFGYVEFATRELAEQAAQTIRDARGGANGASGAKPNTIAPGVVSVNSVDVFVCWMHSDVLQLPSEFTNVQLANIGSVIDKHARKLR